ncbi:PepSY-like domain-containing protein [uncultured Christiangramia sp.]|uniref:PepSY-like domain-containing protein n=1 Tax=Christiangramia sp. 3-2217-3z TaxID=3417564 RepID=UPI002639B3BA|nr:PepSY-like domain-containing protein [uncultured Christiangramia sp.]
MKRFILMTMLVAGSLISCDADDNQNVETPSVVLNTFQSKFPDAQDIEWEKDQENFEVEFEIDQIEHTALINREGNLLKRKNEIEISDLPEVVLQNLQANYEVDKIDDIETLYLEQSIFYQIEIENTFSSKKIIFNQGGEIAQGIEYME